MWHRARCRWPRAWRRPTARRGRPPARRPAAATTAAAPTSPRSILRAFYVAPGSLPLDPRLEEVYVAAMLSTRTGEDHYPGDAVASDTWPGTAPGPRGVLNTMAPTVFDVSGIVDPPAKPPPPRRGAA